MNSGGPFLVTGEYRRFAEFCDACRQYRYIGLCHGPAGVGKTLSARHYAAWDRFESLPAVWHADDQALAAFNDADTIFYTPEIVNSPRAVASDVTRLCNKLHGIREEPRHRAEKIAAQARWAEERRQQDERFLEMDWFAPRDPDDEASSTPSVPEIARVPPRPRLAPARLILVDEADRLKVPSRAGRPGRVKLHRKGGLLGTIFPILVMPSYSRSDSGINCLFIACNHDVQVGMDAISVIETLYCTQQTGGLTRGMILRAIHAGAVDHARDVRRCDRRQPIPLHCVQYATVQFYAAGPSAPV